VGDGRGTRPQMHIKHNRPQGWAPTSHPGRRPGIHPFVIPSPDPGSTVSRGDGPRIQCGVTCVLSSRAKTRDPCIRYPELMYSLSRTPIRDPCHQGRWTPHPVRGDMCFVIPDEDPGARYLSSRTPIRDPGIYHPGRRSGIHADGADSYPRSALRHQPKTDPR
jgi:hypothetical protein